MGASKSVLRRYEVTIYGRMLGPLPAPAPVEPCFKCGRDTRVREPRRACGPCVVDATRGRGGGPGL